MENDEKVKHEGKSVKIRKRETNVNNDAVKSKGERRYEKEEEKKQRKMTRQNRQERIFLNSNILRKK